MILSDTIKKLRREKDLTQEQLAEKLGVSSQAVSKWETSETYPDGSLLVPLANALGVSLDTLFGNDSVYMADVSVKIMKLLHDAGKDNEFDLARDIAWQIERGLFNSRMVIDEGYDPDGFKNQKNASYILTDHGFTLVSNGKEPFFSVFPQPEEGFGDFLNDQEDLRKIFAALADADTMKALIYLYRKSGKYVFESAVLEKECGIASDRIDAVLDDLRFLKIIWEESVEINGQPRTLIYSAPSHKLIAVFLMAKEIRYTGGNCLQIGDRNTPFFKE